MSLRNYLTVEELQDRRPNIAEVDLSVLEQAEKDIDLVTASFVEGANRKGYSSVLLLENVALNGTTATVPTLASTQGYYSYCILEVLSGANAGKRFFITTSNNQTITLNVDSEITETIVCKVFQLGKYPMAKDWWSANNVEYKTIAEEVKEAVAYQYEFRLANAGYLNNKYAQTGYSVSGDSFSTNYNPNIQNSIRERISPQALDLLGRYTTQSL